MSQSNKILIGIVGGVLAVCLAVVGVVSFTGGSGEEATTIPVSSDAFIQQSTTAVPSTTAPVQSTTATSTTSPVNDLKSQLIGKWVDSAGMSGYEFFSDGSVKMTYVNLSAFNIPLDGKADGVYILDGDKLTIKFSIYTATIENKYTIKIDGKTLSMYNIEEFETSTYTRVDGNSQTTTTTTTAPATTTATPIALVGKWSNSDGTLTYSFGNNGQLTAILCNADKTNCTTNEGIYLQQEDSLVVQYYQQNASVTKSYTFSIYGDNLTLTDEIGTTVLLTRVYGETGDPVISPSVESLYGTWTDSSNMMGYEFLRDGTVNVKYVDFIIPVLNMPIKTTVPGNFTVDGDEVTVNHSIYGATIKTTYRFSVRDNVLTLVNTEDGNTSTFMKKD
ncbi:MAG: hypothetical protein IJ349_00240 [Clostridia bacterium]|nr:hypothetical protein [Clostridia bacterium]